MWLPLGMLITYKDVFRALSLPLSVCISILFLCLGWVCLLCIFQPTQYFHFVSTKSKATLSSLSSQWIAKLNENRIFLCAMFGIWRSRNLCTLHFLFKNELLVTRQLHSSAIHFGRCCCWFFFRLLPNNFTRLEFANHHLISFYDWWHIKPVSHTTYSTGAIWFLHEMWLLITNFREGILQPNDTLEF